MNAVANQIMVHVRYDGRSDEIPLDVIFPTLPEEVTQELEHNTTGVAVVGANCDRVMKAGLANHYDRPEGEFNDYVIDRSEANNFTVRPKADFGA
jgi:hypothetical protein